MIELKIDMDAIKETAKKLAAQADELERKAADLRNREKQLSQYINHCLTLQNLQSLQESAELLLAGKAAPQFLTRNNLAEFCQVDDDDL
jgi:hypothetical protein